MGHQRLQGIILNWIQVSCGGSKVTRCPTFTKTASPEDVPLLEQPSFSHNATSKLSRLSCPHYIKPKKTLW